MRKSLGKRNTLLLITSIFVTVIILVLFGTDMIVPNSQEALIKAGDESYELAEYDKALSHYSKVLEKNENNVIAKVSIVKTYLAKDFNDEAKRFVEEYITEHPTSVELLELSLDVYKGDSIKQVEACRLLVKLHEDSSDKENAFKVLSDLIFNYKIDEDKIFEKYLDYSRYNKEKRKKILKEMIKLGFSNEFLQNSYQMYYPSALDYIISVDSYGFTLHIDDELADEVIVTNSINNHESSARNSFHIDKRNFRFNTYSLDEVLITFEISLYKNSKFIQKLYLDDYLITRNSEHPDIDKASFLMLNRLEFEDVAKKVNNEKLVALFQLNGNFDFETVSSLKNLRILSIPNVIIDNTQFVSEIIDLELLFTKDQSFNTKYLSNLTNIRVLELASSNVDIEHFASLNKLEYLSLESGMISGELGKFLNMKYLFLYPKEEIQTNVIEDLDAPNLLRLDLFNMSGDLDDLPEFRSLEKLHITDSPSLKGDISTLSKNRNMRMLRIHGSNLLNGKLKLLSEETIDLNASMQNIGTKYFNNTLAKQWSINGLYLIFYSDETFEMIDRSFLDLSTFYGSYYFSGDKIYCRNDGFRSNSKNIINDMYEFVVVDHSNLKLQSIGPIHGKYDANNGDEFSLSDN